MPSLRFSRSPSSLLRCFVFLARFSDNANEIPGKVADVVKSLNRPAYYVEPDDVMVDEVDEGRTTFPLVQVESGDQDQPEQGGEREHDHLEVVLGRPGAESD